MNNINEIKKALYKEKPIAGFLKLFKGSMLYRCTIKKDDNEDMDVYFNVPVSDIGDAVFEKFMDAKLLIRWMLDPIIEN